MNILYMDWPALGGEDVIEALTNLGHTVSRMSVSNDSHVKIDWPFAEALEAAIRRQSVNLVFSLNYFPTVSEACLKADCKYLAWVYDSPSSKLYCLNIVNACNYIFLFDRYTYEELLHKGVETVYYAPVAVNTERIRKITITEKERHYYGCDVSFVGSLYNEKHNFFERLKEKADEYTIGYLEGVMNAQMQVYGYNFLEECLTEEMIQNIYKVMPYRIEKTSFAALPYIYASYFLCRKITSMERIRILTETAEIASTNLYTNNCEMKLGNCHNKGTVDYYNEMPKVFKLSKINLNITLRSIKSGIPLRAMDIMGAGGFLLTNYQSDFLLHFEPDRDFVYYGSREELADKVRYYLKHDSEREMIAQKGFEKVCKNHTYEVRLQEMLEAAGI